MVSDDAFSLRAFREDTPNTYKVRACVNRDRRRHVECRKVNSLLLSFEDAYTGQRP